VVSTAVVAGAFIASIWLLCWRSHSVQWVRFSGKQLLTTQDPQALLQQMTEAQASGNIPPSLGIVEKGLSRWWACL
jgi:hypothetical protein